MKAIFLIFVIITYSVSTTPINLEGCVNGRISDDGRFIHCGHGVFQLQRELNSINELEGFTCPDARLTFAKIRIRCNKNGESLIYQLNKSIEMPMAEHSGADLGIENCPNAEFSDMGRVIYCPGKSTYKLIASVTISIEQSASFILNRNYYRCSGGSLDTNREHSISCPNGYTYLITNSANNQEREVNPVPKVRIEQNNVNRSNSTSN